MAELTFSQFLAFLTAWTLATVVIADLVWYRRVRRSRQAARSKLRETRARNRYLEERLTLRTEVLTPPAVHAADVADFAAARARRRGRGRGWTA